MGNFALALKDAMNGQHRALPHIAVKWKVSHLTAMIVGLIAQESESLHLITLTSCTGDFQHKLFMPKISEAAADF